MDEKSLTVCPIVPDKKVDVGDPTKKRFVSGIDSSDRLFLQRLVEDNALLAKFEEKSVCFQVKFSVLRNISGYLSELGVECAVIEHAYVDRDFLDDYSRYYSRCHAKYERWCHRIHFFSKASGDSKDSDDGNNQENIKTEWQDRIDKILLQPDGESDETAFSAFKGAYLGFVVIRPLATAIVGRTCLKIYPDERYAGERHYTALTDVPVSFFGRKLTIRCMPFLQQDSTTAACASCSLWSAHLVTAKLFSHVQYCPGCITALATEHGMYEGQNFPNKKGLYDRDMVYAIRRIGLEPICFGGGFYNGEIVPSQHELLGRIYAYLRAGLPVVLMGDLFYWRMAKNDKGESLPKEKRPWGRHAVTVNGYHLRDSRLGDNDCFKSDRIDKIYVHDDQVGPGARVFCDGEKWRSDWLVPDDADDSKAMYMENLAIIVPVYPKMRVAYDMVVEQVNVMRDTLMNLCYPERIENPDGKKRYQNLYKRYSSYSPLEYELNECGKQEWDVRLQTCEMFKCEIRNDPLLRDKDDSKLSRLKRGYPKYLWNVGFAIRDEGNGLRNILQFIIDATDSGLGLRVIDMIKYSDSLDMFWMFTNKFIDCLPSNLLLRHALEAVLAKNNVANEDGLA